MSQIAIDLAMVGEALAEELREIERLDKESTDAREIVQLDQTSSVGCPGSKPPAGKSAMTE